MTSLWGEEFSVDTQESNSKILKKIKEPKAPKAKTAEQVIKSKSVSIEDKVETIKKEVFRILGQHADNSIVITTEEGLVKYFDKAIENGIIAVDTETNNTLDTIDCKLMGLCIYTPGMKSAYVPVNHINRLTNIKLDNQISEEFIGTQLQRLLDNNVKEIYHNASFDIGVLWSTCGVRLKADWDTMIAAKVLDENELAGLKAQYKLHINPEQEKYSIENLFQGLPYEIFEPDLFALYAATDSFMTYELYKYQLEQFMLPDNKQIYESTFLGIEIPVIDAIVDMEHNGIKIDKEYSSKMSIVYHEMFNEVQSKIDDELKVLSSKISEWRVSEEATTKPLKRDIVKDGKIYRNTKTGETYLQDDKKIFGKSKSEQLADPIEPGSPTQMAILLYDILKVPVIDKSKPRGTGEDILTTLAEEHHIKICSLLLEKRGIDILINTFIDKMPELVHESTGRLHAKFNQYGAATGRLSSSDPNLQNIPSHDKLIRMMFTADKGYSIIGADFGAQEPRSLASFSHDEAMLKAYDEDKDLYAVIGTAAFKNNYEDNLEFHPETHALQPEGKVRRSKCKTILLGIMYGMSSRSLAARLECPLEEAEQIINNFYDGFKGVKQFTLDSQKMLRTYGYVTDIWGRRRRIPDALLPDYSIKPDEYYRTPSSNAFNPLLDVKHFDDEELLKKIDLYNSKLSKATWKRDIDAIIAQAKKEHLVITSNKGFISRSLRQCLNARIQGTAASMTKRAMTLIHNDDILKSLGFRLLISVHDEVFGEAPIANAEKASERLSELMVLSAKPECCCKFKCDPYIVTDGWYEDECVGEVLKDYKKQLSKLNGDKELAIDNLVNGRYKMFSKDAINLVCEDKYTLGVDSLKYGANYYKNIEI